MRNAECTIQVKFGQLRLRTLSLVPQAGFQPAQVAVRLEGKAVPATFTLRDGRCLVRFGPEITITAGQALEVNLRQ